MTETDLKPWWESILLRKDDRFQMRFVKILTVLESHGVPWPESGERAFLEVRDGSAFTDDADNFNPDAVVSLADIRETLTGIDRRVTTLPTSLGGIDTNIIHGLTADCEFLASDDGYLSIPAGATLTHWCYGGEAIWRPGYTCPTTSKTKSRLTKATQPVAARAMFGAA